MNFQYVDVNTNEAVVLNSIDELLCEMHKEEVDAKEYHPSFTFLQYMGLNCLLHASKNNTGDGYTTDEKSVEAFLKTLNPEDYEDGHKELMREFFYRRYYYRAWR